MLRASPANSSNFCTIWRMNSDFYLLFTNFFKYTFQQILYLIQILFLYLLFILFLTTTHLPTFFYSPPDYYNRKKNI